MLRGHGAPPRDDALTVELAGGADEGTAGQSPPEPEPGTVLGSRYRLQAIIGRGGTSTVFRARDLRAEPSSDTSSELVAVKLLRGRPSTEASAPARLQREFHTMRALSHRGIARVYELDRDGDIWFMSMELISGQTLTQWMSTGASYSQALRIIDSCCETLEYAHSRGVVHGDLNPTNVLVSEDGSARLIDFGSSSIADARADAGSAPAIAATPLYASPQILAGHRAEQLDDVFSLACLSYSILSGGRHPYGGRPSFEAFRAKSAPTYVRAIPVELFAIIERGLSADRARRPASVSEFRRELIEAEQRRCANVCLSRPAASSSVQKSSAHPAFLAPAMAELARRVAALLGGFGSAGRLAPVKAVVSVIAVLAAVAGAVVFSRLEPVQSRNTGAENLPAARVETFAAPTIAVKASTPQMAPAQLPPAQLAPASERAPSLSPKAAPAPSAHDSSSISFKAALIHINARQSLVAITVTREPANRTPGPFVWRLERGNAIPAIDYKRIEPRRVSFNEGQTVRTLFIPLLNKTAARVPPGPRFFDVVLQSVAGGPALGRIARITVVIDPTPSIWVAKSDAVGSHILR